MTQREFDRRQAITLFGVAGVSAVVLGACGGADDAGTSAAGSTTTTGAAGGSGTTAIPAAPSGALTAASFQGAANCTATPEQTDGPYYIDVDKIRGDIREDRVGTRLRVAARVMDVDGCTPVKDAVFEIWHCDAGGLYSGFEQASQGGGGGQRDDSRYLRGAQVTNAEGIAEITTIYPGWYRGRTAHIHAKVFLSNTEQLTTQLYFDEAINSAVYKTAPYDARSGRDTFNADDGFYRRETTMTVSQDGDGYLGLMTIGISA